MNKTSTKFTPPANKLTAYSALAGAFIAVTPAAKGAIVPVDVNPDSTVVGDVFEIDLDNDGNPEFTIGHASYAGVMAVQIYTANNAAGIIGYSNAYKYATKLNAGDSVGPNQAFINLGNTWGTLAYDGPYGQFGQWHGTVDGYVGFSFTMAGNTHYGWIRLDVAQDASFFIIKSYAYEDAADTPILAGATGLAGIKDGGDLAKVGITAYSYGNRIYLNATNGEFIKGDIKVYNTLGQLVNNTKGGQSNIQIELNDVTTGIYFLEIVIDGVAYRKQFYIDSE